jgi:quercetin dioxygenase-like cupin family protein
MEKNNLKNIFDKVIGSVYSKVESMDRKPEVVLIQDIYDIYNEKQKFDIYIDTFNSNERVNDEFNSLLREKLRLLSLVKYINYRIFYNTDVPERFDSLVSLSEEFRTDLEKSLSGYDSDDNYFEVEYVAPENTNWKPYNRMFIKVIVRLNTNEPNNDDLVKAGEKTLQVILTRMVKGRYSDFEAYSLHMDVEELDYSNDNEETINEETIKEKLKNHATSIRTKFLEELESSGQDAKIAYKDLQKIINGGKNVTPEEKKIIETELKGVLKRTLKKLGLLGLFLLPGGSVFIILLKIFEKRRNRKSDDEKPYSENMVSEGVKFRTFDVDVDTDELKWHRDRQDRLVEVIEGENWGLQFDNELPINLVSGQSYIIPEGMYHRVIKGDSELKVKITYL